MRSVHFMPVIAFDLLQMSNMKHKVAPHWIKVDISRQFAENCSNLVFETVDVYIVAASFVD